MMRLFLLPISTRRTLIYCQKLNVATAEKQSWLDKGTTKAANLWAGWEKKESGWQRKVVDYGNQALKRIPYEEWGLKSIPPLSKRKEAEDLSSKEIEVSFPSTLIPKETVTEVLRTLGTERQKLHKSRMIYCFIGMPISAPFALVPIVPNLPFFYLVFRAWSHWKALSGAKHVQFLVENKLVKPKPSKILDDLYSNGQQPFATNGTEKSTPDTAGAELEEKMVLHKSNGKRIAEALDIPDLDIELDRAVWQVEKALREKQELKEEKEDLEKANTKPEEKK